MPTLIPRTFAITFDQKSKILKLLKYYYAERTPEGKEVLDMLVHLPELHDSLPETQEPLPEVSSGFLPLGDF